MSSYEISTQKLLRLARASLNLRVVLTHSFLAYLPVSFAVTRRYDQDAILYRGVVSFFYVSLFGILNCTVNDFFDRAEDLFYKSNPFDHDTATGLAFVLILLALSLVLFLVIGSIIDLRIIVLSILAIALSWSYSDNMYMIRFVGFRLKSHYLLEIVAMVVGYVLIFVASLAINRVLIRAATPLVILVGLEFARRTIAKDIPDSRKDRRAGNVTIPVAWGRSRSTRVMDSISLGSLLVLAYFSIADLLPLPAIVAAAWIPTEIVLRNRLSLYHKLRFLLDVNPFFLLVSLGILIS